MKTTDLESLVPYTTQMGNLEKMIEFMSDAPAVRVNILRPHQDPEKALQFSVNLAPNNQAGARESVLAELREQHQTLKTYLVSKGVKFGVAKKKAVAKKITPKKKPAAKKAPTRGKLK